MKKTIALSLLLALGCVAAPVGAQEAAEVAAARNATYDFYGQKVMLADGKAESDIVAHGLARLLTVALEQPAPAVGELNGDGIADAAVLLRQESNAGNSAGYYLAVTATQPDGTRQGSNAVLLGENVVPQELTVADGVIRVRFDVPQKNGAARSVSKDYALLGGKLAERGPAPAVFLKPLPKRSVLADFRALLGVEREALLQRMAETPNPVDEGSWEFAKAGIRVWFVDNTVSQVFITSRTVSFNGLRLGDGIVSFKGVFGPLIAEKAGVAEFAYNGCTLQIVYDQSSGKTAAAYLLQRVGAEKEAKR